MFLGIIKSSLKSDNIDRYINQFFIKVLLCVFKVYIHVGITDPLEIHFCIFLYISIGLLPNKYK